MPFTGEVTLDFCDTETRAATREDVVRAARQTPLDLNDWYLTLRRGSGPDEEYMDATMEGEAAFSLRCREDGKQYRTVGAVNEDVLQSLLVSFHEHDRVWKALCDWEEIPGKRGFGIKDLFR